MGTYVFFIVGGLFLRQITSRRKSLGGHTIPCLQGFTTPPKLKARIAEILNILTVVLSQKKLSSYWPPVAVSIDALKLFHKFWESQEVIGLNQGQ